MSVLKFISSNAKRIVGCSLLLSLMAVQSVGAAGSSIELKSKGNIEYDSDKDGTPDVLFYSKDLTTISEGIDDINGNMVILSQSFDDLANASAGYKSDIIAGLNSNVYAKNNIAADSSFEDIISKINNIPAPTTATGNVWTTGDNSGVGITANGQSVDIDGVTSLNLVVNESVTLPSGYYPNDITISNNVANRGSLSLADYIADGSTSFPEGFYSTSKLDEIYNKGVLDGDHGFKGARVTYYLVHQHVDGAGNLQTANDYIYSNPGGCYTRSESYTYYTTETYVDTWTEWTGNDSGSGHEEYIEHHETKTRQVPHTGTRYACTCGHIYHDDEPSTTDYDSILPTQLIRSVNVELF